MDKWVVNVWQMEDRRMGRWLRVEMGEKMKDAWMARWANWWVHQHRNKWLRDGWITGQVMGQGIREA